MEGTIMNFRGGKHTKYDNQMIVELEGIQTKEKAASYLNKTILWKTPTGKIMTGKITQVHGNKGRVRVMFERGMPGQAITKKVEVR